MTTPRHNLFCSNFREFHWLDVKRLGQAIHMSDDVFVIGNAAQLVTLGHVGAFGVARDVDRTRRSGGPVELAVNAVQVRQSVAEIRSETFRIDRHETLKTDRISLRNLSVASFW